MLFVTPKAKLARVVASTNAACRTLFIVGKVGGLKPLDEGGAALQLSAYVSDEHTTMVARLTKMLSPDRCIESVVCQ